MLNQLSNADARGVGGVAVFWHYPVKWTNFKNIIILNVRADVHRWLRCSFVEGTVGIGKVT